MIGFTEVDSSWFSISLLYVSGVTFKESPCTSVIEWEFSLDDAFSEEFLFSATFALLAFWADSEASIIALAAAASNNTLSSKRKISIFFILCSIILFPFLKMTWKILHYILNRFNNFKS